MSRALPLVYVERGGIEESLHRGAFVLAEGTRSLAVLGDPSWPVFYRSTSKPMQTLVGVTSGAADAFGITAEELAIASGSHNATEAQLACVRSLLGKAHFDEDALQCGGHWSIDPELRREQQRTTDQPPPIWSNCSGKHALMLATARHLGAPLETYLAFDHPVQVEIRRHIAVLCDVPLRDARMGVDGCGTPAFVVPLDGMARSLARLGAPDGLPDELRAACRQVGDACLAWPDRIAGAKRFDTDLMESSASSLIAKGGAEGVHGWAAPNEGLGFAIKAEDGRDRGYRPVVLEVLERLGLLTSDEAEGLRARQCDPVVRSWSGQEVGRLRVAPGVAERLP